MFFFFKCGFSPIPLFSYFFSWLLMFFKVYYINIRKLFYFFNVKFETLSYIYSMFTRKKLCFFNVRKKNIFGLNILT